MRLLLAAIGTIVACSLVPASSLAQELVPRAYWPTPKGTNVLVVGYQYSTGDVVTDATLPIEGVESTINYLQASYQRTLSLFGRTTNLQFNLPYAHGTTEGLVEGEFRRRDVSAMGDARFVLSINLLGAPSMDGAAFRELTENPRPIVGASILIQPPTGAYESDKFINAGSNRWSTKLGMGAIWPVGSGWLLETHVGVWFFGDNDEFVGTTRQQDSVYSAEAHLVRHTRSGFWTALDLNYYAGGRTTVDEEQRDDLQRNSRIGATLLYPLKARHAIRASFSTGIITRTGGEYDTVTVSYVYLWQ